MDRFLHLINKLFVLIWEIIQNTVGWIEFKYHHLKIDHRFKNSYIIYIDYFDSHVLGKYIFINPKTDENIILRHEYGHRVQSIILGPFYLFLIFIPSFLHYLIFEKSGKDWSEYYKFYTENWADNLTKKKEK
jgi:hypothetical protein